MSSRIRLFDIIIYKKTSTERRKHKPKETKHREEPHPLKRPENLPYQNKMYQKINYAPVEVSNHYGFSGVKVCSRNSGSE